MNKPQYARLEDAFIASFQQRFGAAALQPLSALRDRPTLPGFLTGFKELDALLGEKGIPRGQVTEIIGIQTSGATSLTYNIIPAVQKQKQYAVYVDVESTYNPIYAKLCGIDKDLFFLVRPDTEVKALDIARDLIQKGSVGMIVLDLGETRPNPHDVRRLASHLSQFGCAVVLLQLVDDEAALRAILGHISATLRLLVNCEEFITRRKDIIGYRSQVSVSGHYAGASKQATIEINIDLDGRVT